MIEICAVIIAAMSFSLATTLCFVNYHAGMIVKALDRLNESETLGEKLSAQSILKHLDQRLTALEHTVDEIEDFK